MSTEQAPTLPQATDAGPSTDRDGVTAIAYPNMALVKYWGKRDETLILPATSSLSMTLDIFPTTTRVTLRRNADADAMVLNGRTAPPGTHQRVERFLDLVRAMAGRTEPALVESNNTVPTGAGLASSASGFAALAAAAAAAYGLRLDRSGLSRLARRGSGSACRSVFGGFVVWHAGSGVGRIGDESSYAEPVEPAALDPALVFAIVDTGYKSVPSRTAMRHTALTSPFHLPWTEASAADLATMRAAIGSGDLAAAGRIAEHNALGMHGVMLAARPAIRYLSPESLRVLDCVDELRANGIDAYATIDAGPNVAVLCSREETPRVVVSLRRLGDSVTTRVAHAGQGVTVQNGAVA